MALLKDEVQNEARERFKKLTGPVRLVNFTQKIECHYCEETRSLIEEIASLSPKISSQIYNFAWIRKGPSSIKSIRSRLS